MSRQNVGEIEFPFLIMEQLSDAICCVDRKGYIFHFNDHFSFISGYTPGDDQNPIFFPSLVIGGNEDWDNLWEKVRTEGKWNTQVLWKHKNGMVTEAEIIYAYVEHGTNGVVCVLVRDLQSEIGEETLLKTVSEHTSSLVGKDFFHELTRTIANCLSVRYALITECSEYEKTRIRTISYIDKNEILENIEYNSIGTPCEIIMKGNDFFQQDEVEKNFPQKKGIKSYIGVPIYKSSTGEVMGHMAAYDDRPMAKRGNLLSVLKIFAARAGAELERMEIHRKLEQANIQLQDRLQEIEVLKNRLQAENHYLQSEIKLSHNFEEIISKSSKFKEVLRQVEQVANTDATVLILGESGTGKELIARALHNISNRSKRALVKVNCAALPANLIESELFGHEKGAFTGALDRKIGRFELADGGTIFLDEIGELPIDLQAKLLRVLQEGEFERLGNSKTLKINVRVITATNRDLKLAIENKEFREDLYYRLNVFPISCPPLRERKEDIPLLVKFFCQKFETKIGKRISHVSEKVMKTFLEYHWPGNIRELENMIERAMILSRNETLEAGDWLPCYKTQVNATVKLQTLEDVERTHILSILETTRWKVSGENGAAKILGLNPTTLEARMKKLGISRTPANIKV